MEETLSRAEQVILLKIAREALENSAEGLPLPQINLSSLPPTLQELGASFVTLTIGERLRGCIGTLEAYQPLGLDVQEHAMAAALQDPRFPQVRPEECPQIHIEVSMLTPKVPLDYRDVKELLEKIRPGVDGVILQDGYRKATFLPQVWEKLPNSSDFLSHLCNKMGAPSDLWQKKPLKVFVYQVQEFHEE